MGLRSSLPVAALATLLCLACSRDLQLPAERQRPTIAGFTPSEGFAEDVVAVGGTGFDPSPANNQVFFNNQPAKGSGFDAQGRLLVSVPYGISGYTVPLVVQTPYGRSEPKDGFFNLGAGHPITGIAVGTAQVRHQPSQLVACGGDLFVPSQYFQVLLTRSGKQFRLAQKPTAVASAGCARFLVGLDDQTVVAIDAATGAQTRVTGLVQAPQFLDQQAGRFLSVGLDANQRPQAALVDAQTLAVLAQRPLTVLGVRGAVLAPDGRQAVLAAERDVQGRPVSSLLVIDLEQPLAPARALDLQPGRAFTGPLALGTANGTPVIVAALDDGTAVTVPLPASGADPIGQPAAPIRLVSQGHVGGLAAVGSTLVASKPQEGVVLGVDLDKGQVVWAVPTRGAPSVLAIDSSSNHVLVSDGSSNAFDEVGLDGRWLGRFVLGTGLGSTPACDCAPAANYPRTYDGTNHVLFFLAPLLNALVPLDSYSLALLPSVPLASDATPALGLVGSPRGQVYVLHRQELGVLQDGAEKILLRNLTQQPAGVGEADAHTLVLRSLHELTVVKDGEIAGRTQLNDGALLRHFVTPDATLAFWGNAQGQVLGAKWTLDALAKGAAPQATFTPPADAAGFLGMLKLGERLLLFYSSCKDHAGGCVVPVDADLKAGATQDSPLSQATPLSATPDGRYFLWNRRFPLDGVIHLTFDDGAGLDYINWPAPTGFAQPAFDPSGEWLYVPVPDDDSIHVLQ